MKEELEEERMAIVAIHPNQVGEEREGTTRKKLIHFAANCPTLTHVTRGSEFILGSEEVRRKGEVREKEKRECESGRRALWLYLFVGIRMGNGEK